MESSDINSEHLGTITSKAERDCRMGKVPDRLWMRLSILFITVFLVKGLLFTCANFLLQRVDISQSPQSRGNFSKEDTTEREIVQLHAQVQQLIETLQNITKDPRCHLCPDRWHWFWGHCYFFSVGLEEDLKWVQSAQYCLERNGSLGVIHNQAEMEFVLGQMRKHSEIPFVWLGLSDSQKEGQWVWEDGTPLQKHKFVDIQWDSEQRDCADLRGDGSVFACDCDSYGPWLCKKCVEPPPNTGTRIGT